MIKTKISHGTAYSYDKSELLFVNKQTNGITLVFKGGTEVLINIDDKKDIERQYTAIIVEWKVFNEDPF